MQSSASIQFVSAAAERTEIRCWADMCAAAPSAFAAATGLEVAHFGSTIAVVAPRIPSIEFNRAVGLGLDPMTAGAELRQLVQLYRDRSSPDAIIQIIPQLITPTLAGELKAAGTAPRDREWVVLERLTGLPPSVPTNLEIVEAGRSDAMRAAQCFCRGYGLPDVFDGFVGNLVGRPRWRTFMALDAGKPIATAFLYQEGDRAVLAGAGTVPEARGRGAQKALMAARIAAAAQDGTATIQTHTGLPLPGEPSPSLSNMQSMGFTIVHHRRNYVVARASKAT